MAARDTTPTIRTDRTYLKFESATDKDKVRQFLESIHAATRIGRELGMNNPLDKNFYRQIELAHILGHSPSPSSSGRGIPDAFDNKTSRFVEYKTLTLKKLPKRGKMLNGRFPYSSATNVEAIERTDAEDHYYAWFLQNTNECAVIVRLENEAVKQKLYESYESSCERARRRGDTHTNRRASTLDVGVAVSVDIWNETCENGEILFVCPSLKGVP